MPEQVPAALRRFIEVYVRGEPLAPVVRIDTRRTAATLRDAYGTVLLELAADDVTASVIGADGADGEVKAWHELEAREVVHGDLELLEAVTSRLEARRGPPELVAVEARPRAGGPRFRRPDPAQLPLGSAVAALDAYLGGAGRGPAGAGPAGPP